MHAINARHCLAMSLAALLVQPAPAAACAPYPPPIALPDESKEAFGLRTRSLLAARNDEERRSWQQSSFDRAERVLLARVTAVRNTPDERFPLVTAHTFLAIKGDPPAAALEVRDRRGRSCAAIVGGVRRAARIGDYIILFDATRLNPGDPQVTLEIPVHEARDPRLIDALYSVPFRLREKARP